MKNENENEKNEKNKKWKKQKFSDNHRSLPKSWREPTQDLTSPEVNNNILHFLFLNISWLANAT